MTNNNLVCNSKNNFLYLRHFQSYSNGAIQFHQRILQAFQQCHNPRPSCNPNFNSRKNHILATRSKDHFLRLKYDIFKKNLMGAPFQGARRGVKNKNSTKFLFQHLLNLVLGKVKKVLGSQLSRFLSNRQNAEGGASEPPPMGDRGKQDQVVNSSN